MGFFATTAFARPRVTPETVRPERQVQVPGLRYYSPTIGRWVSRDPVYESVEADVVISDEAASPYVFVGNGTTDRADLLGLTWDVYRENQFRAPAACCDDTVAALAHKIGLHEGEYRAWLRPTDGGGLPNSEDEKIKGRRHFEIPNTLVAYWAGNLGEHGKSWVGWANNVSYLRERGFDVVQVDHRAGMELFLGMQSRTLASASVLHGLYFWGHGTEKGLDWYPKYPSGSGGEKVLTDAEVRLLCHMAFGAVFACKSNHGRNALVGSPVPGQIWNGYDGRLMPVPRRTEFALPHVVRPGQQETQFLP
jgi:hypothetical protein